MIDVRLKGDDLLSEDKRQKLRVQLAEKFAHKSQSSSSRNQSRRKMITIVQKGKRFVPVTPKNREHYRFFICILIIIVCCFS